MVWLKGKSKLKQIDDIWNKKEELKISNLDKVSFENLLIKLEEMVEKLVATKEFSIFEIEELEDVFTISSISQKFIFIDENKLNSEIIEKVLFDYKIIKNINFKEKKEFLLNILSQFDFVIPTKKLKYRVEGS